MASNALVQGFYLSPQFRRLSIETRDYRLHPVLGGISSTRWNSYASFAAENGRLVSQLAERAAAATAIQLSTSNAAAAPSLLPADAGVSSVQANRWSLGAPGLLSGDGRSNQLGGSDGDDVLLGWEGNDQLAGGRGDDLLSGGPGRDLFLFEAVADQSGEFDEITDFNGRAGDRIRIKGGRTLRLNSGDFQGHPGEVIGALWMAKIDPSVPGSDQPWMSRGIHLAIDRDGDQRADLTISLPGLMEVRREWVLFN